MLIAVLALLAAAPAHANAPGQGDLAAYLRARAADGAGQGDVALEAYRAALAGAPDSPLVAIRTYREALAAGDAALARRAAAVLTRADVAPIDAALLPLADAARADDPAAATRALDALAADRLRLLVPPLRGWIAATQGQDGPAASEAPPTDAAARRLSTENRALLLFAAGRINEALVVAAPLASARPDGFRIAAGEILFGADRPDQARRLIGDDPAALAAAQAGATADPGLAYGVSRLLLRIADDLADERSSPLAIALARAALAADPGYARARIVLADELGRAGDFARALAELDRVPAAGPLGPQVAARRIDLLNRQDRPADALAIARALAEGSDATPRDRARYADLLFADNRPAEALPFYKRVLSEPEARDSWAAWLRYGGALDEAGRWRDAEKALRRAVKIAPDEPSTLNYLGYSLVDRRKDVDEGTRMLERARALAPDDPAIADSLGWAYHRAGDTARALPLVEAAAAELPADAEVNDHLGDLYWTLGRRYEARYAWRAAQLTATPANAPRIAAKLASGLP